MNSSANTARAVTTLRSPHPASPTSLATRMTVSEREKYSYFGLQHRWYLVARFLAFVGLLVSLIRFSYADARISGLLLIVVLLLVVSLVSLYTSTRPRRMTQAQHRDLVDSWPVNAAGRVPAVDVFLPTAGEAASVLDVTYRHVAAMGYPGSVEVYVLDDSDRLEVAVLAAEYGFQYLSRPDRGRMKKAGNLAYGFAHSAGDVIAVFDADFAPRADYLTELMPYLDDPKVGIAQSPQFFQTRGAASWLQQAAGATQELFYRWVQPSRDAIGAPICVGTCAIYRRTALIEAGGFAQIQHSEDVHTGVNVMGAGYAVRYVPIVLAKGLCPTGLTAFINQQYRWCAGSMSLMVSRDFHHMSLTGKQRLCFWSGFGYYITTAVTGFTALIPPVFLLWLAPEAIHPRNYLWLVPLMLVYPLMMALHRGKWTLSVLRIQLIYSFAHALAVWDTYRGQTAEWVATGTVEHTPLSLKVVRLIMVWTGLTQVALWGGVARDLATRDLSIGQLWPLITLAAFSVYVQVPVFILCAQVVSRRARPESP